MQKNNQDKEMTLCGYVAASEWDAGDNVVAINILTDVGEYDVELNELAVELYDFLDEDIEVTGILKKGRNGTKLLKVTNYKPLGNRGYDPEDDECLEEVKVTLEDSTKGKKSTAKTDNFGDFWFEGLEVGEYAVTIEKDGYHSRQVKSISTEKDVNLGDIELYKKGKS